MQNFTSATVGTKNKASILGVVVWCLAVSFFLYEFALRTILGTFTHQIIPALHLTPFTYSIIDSAYSLTFVLFSIPMGVLTDRFGIRWTMPSTMAMLAFATLFYSFAPSFTDAFLSRLLMGVGSSLSFVSVVVIIMMWFPKRLFAFLVGLSQFIATLGPMLGAGPLIYFVHKTHQSWRQGLHSIAIFGLFMVILMLLFVREKKRNAKVEAQYIQGVGQVLHYLKILFKNKQVWLTVLYTTGSYSGFQILCTVWGVEFLQVRGLTQLAAANCVTFGWIGYAIACPLLGVLSDMLKRRNIIMMICALLGIIFVLGFTYINVESTYFYVICFFMLGVAASGQNLSFVLLAEKVDPKVKASATAFNNGFISITVAVFTLISSFFINHAVHGSITHIHVQDFYLGFAILPAAFVFALVLCFFIREKSLWFAK